jgi:DNA-binding NtrC family response regulator
VRVLIVEDEEAVREVLRDFVAGLGHEPAAVATAEQALEELGHARPDAILLDVRLPGISGLALLAQPAVRASGVPVVVVSGLATEDEARACLRLGALDYIRKPVTLDRLKAVLESLEPFAPAQEPSEARRPVERRWAPPVSV